MRTERRWRGLRDGCAIRGRSVDGLESFVGARVSRRKRVLDAIGALLLRCENSYISPSR